MRLWSLHPSLLDRQGLTALWREGLLAQAVLAGRTEGYTNHPQLNRFKATDDPLAAITTYLKAVQAEATARGYNYDLSRIDAAPAFTQTLPVTTEQVAFELEHLRRKLEVRSPERLDTLPQADAPVHPSFHIISGPIADWERP